MADKAILDTKIEFLKGVGPQRADLLQTELGIFTFADLLEFYPFRYEDRSTFHLIREVYEEQSAVQLRGRIKNFAQIGQGKAKRLVAQFQDATGIIELVWFQGATWVMQKLKPNVDYIVYGKPSLFGSKLNIAHPEVEPDTEASSSRGMVPVYHSTEKMKRKFLESKALSKLTRQLLDQVKNSIPETLPEGIRKRHQLLTKAEAMEHIHHPANEKMLDRAQATLKFEELFYLQLQMLLLKQDRQRDFEGFVFRQIPSVNAFYKNHLPFDLTQAQKRVIREIYTDMGSGKQMNRLLQGDVGSGKTIVAFICMLMALDHQTQACLMAPTEILAEQHFQGLKVFADKLNLPIALLTGSTRKSERNRIHEQLISGELNILIGTHAVLEDVVRFKKLGLVVIDEQHRFGVQQRAKLWSKNKDIRPHVLVMTATPIPRTLAMTLYGDLDVSIIDELPVGRKPIKTLHQRDSDRLKVLGFIRKQIEEGRQAYIVYPLIEESEKLDLRDVMEGYAFLTQYFKEYKIGILHGQMSPENKEMEMRWFAENKSQILVATTVIEVGINVPNATVMVIENAERFGLSQLHQLRGRVGRGADQSYCLLMTKDQLGTDSRTRIQTMVRTNNGFEIAETDLKLRGPGDLMGTQQSGVLNLKLTNLSSDYNLIKASRDAAQDLLHEDPELQKPGTRLVKDYIGVLRTTKAQWSRIS